MKTISNLKKQGFRYICGVDEAGRGPLAGPLSLSFFVISIDEHNKVLNKLKKKGLNDSKQVKEAKREELFEEVKNLNFHNAMVSASQIDKHGISKCMQILIKRLLKKVPNISKTYFYLDGAIKFPKEINHEVVIKGDTKIPTIMAASISAKVLRDRKMRFLAKVYPAYGFDVHKGYGTLRHRTAIKKVGVCEEHRRSFCRNIVLPRN